MLARVSSFLALAAGLFAAGCGGSDDEGAGSNAFTTAINPTGGDTGIDPDDGGDGGIKLDTQAGDGTGNGSAEGSVDSGCEKVDFVFVIDSSGSMQDEQVNLLSSFPGFINAIEQTLDLDDFHLMVVDAGAIAGVGCDGTLGAGRVTSGMGQDCGLAGQTRYATQEQADLASVFSCMGARGYMGEGNEQTMDALLASIGPLNAEGQCNAGFLRDDAILVVTIITDEEDNPADLPLGLALDGTCQPADADPNSAGWPDTWANAIIDAKQGDSAAVVVLSLLGDCDMAGGTCAGIVLDPLNPAAAITGAEPAPCLHEFTGKFGFGSVGPVCSPDYTPFFLDAVSVIASACDDFDPPG